MVNPVIRESSKGMDIKTEGCLSIIGVSGRVKRNISVSVDYMNMKGEKQFKKFTGFEARIVQHEIDHLDGILFIDKLN